MPPGDVREMLDERVIPQRRRERSLIGIQAKNDLAPTRPGL